MSKKIVLTESEITIASTVGIKRQLECIRNKLQDKHGHDGAGWNLHVEGACGELVVAKALGLYWDGSVNTFKTGDDVPGLQVRTRSKDWYELIIRKDDDPDAKFVLVTGVCPVYRIHGWMLGSDAMQEKWLKEYGGREAAYFVPQDALLRSRP